MAELQGETRAQTLTTNATTREILRRKVDVNEALHFSARVIARNAADAALFGVTALVRRVGSGNIVLIGSAAPFTAIKSGGASAWAVSAAIDTATQEIVFSVTGVAATTIDWFIQLQGDIFVP